MGMFSKAPSAEVKAKHVVVIGAGLAGAGMARIADKAGFKVTVIERRTGSVYKAGGSRGINDPEWAMTKMLVPIRALVSGSESKRVQNDVVAIDAASKTISLSSGGTLEYDYAVVAVGAQNLSPAEPPLGVYNLAGIREHYEHVSAAIKAAKKIVVVGGGAVGMETAGYTRDHIDASVSMTVVHSGPFLIDASLKGVEPKTLEAFSARILKQSADAKIDIVLNRRVTSMGAADAPGGYKWMDGSEFTVELDNGTVLTADLVLWCIGSRSNAPQMMPESSMEPGSKLIKVNRKLEVEGMEGVFAIGDCTNIKEPKLLTLARSKVGLPPGTPEGHADVVLANLITLAAGKPASKEWVTPLTKLQIAIPITKKVGGSAIGVPNFAAGLKGGAFEFFAFTHWMSTGQKASKALFVTEADETAIVPLAEAPAKSPAVAPAKSP